MSTLALEQPIKLIEQGENLQAQKILMDMLAINPHNLPAWYWYVKTYDTDKERIRALKLCLKYNPENEQVKLTLSKLQEQANKPVASLSVTEESDANDGKQMSALYLIFSVLFLLFTAFFIAECKFVIFDIPWRQYWDYGLLMLLIRIFLILVPQWALICLVAPVVIIILRNQHNLTALILGRIGVLVAFLFAAPTTLFYLLTAQPPQTFNFMLIHILSLMQFAVFVGAFGFFVSTGLGTIGIVIHDIVTYIQHRIQAYRSGENLL